MTTITEKTKVNLGTVVAIVTAIAGLAGTAGTALYRVGEAERAHERDQVAIQKRMEKDDDERKQERIRTLAIEHAFELRQQRVEDVQERLDRAVARIEGLLNSQPLRAAKWTP